MSANVFNGLTPQVNERLTQPERFEGMPMLEVADGRFDLRDRGNQLLAVGGTILVAVGGGVLINVTTGQALAQGITPDTVQKWTDAIKGTQDSLSREAVTDEPGAKYGCRKAGVDTWVEHAYCTPRVDKVTKKAEKEPDSIKSYKFCLEESSDGGFRYIPHEVTSASCGIKKNPNPNPTYKDFPGPKEVIPKRDYPKQGYGDPAMPEEQEELKTQRESGYDCYATARLRGTHVKRIEGARVVFEDGRVCVNGKVRGGKAQVGGQSRSSGGSSSRSGGGHNSGSSARGGGSGGSSSSGASPAISSSGGRPVMDCDALIDGDGKSGGLAPESGMCYVEVPPTRSSGGGASGSGSSRRAPAPQAPAPAPSAPQAPAPSAPKPQPAPSTSSDGRRVAPCDVLFADPDDDLRSAGYADGDNCYVQ